MSPRAHVDPSERDTGMRVDAGKAKPQKRSAPTASVVDGIWRRIQRDYNAHCATAQSNGWSKEATVGEHASVFRDAAGTWYLVTPTGIEAVE